MILYMIRHGESKTNAIRYHAGWAQTPLSEKGIEQARKAGEKLRLISFDRIYSSDLKRAMQTCELALPGREYEPTPLLREISVGSLSGKSIAQCEALYGAAYFENKARRDFTPYGGENGDMQLDRVRQFKKSLESINEGCIAAFCHGGTLRAMLDLVMDQPMKREHIACVNCCIAVFEYTENTWRMLGWNI